MEDGIQDSKPVQLLKTPIEDLIALVEQEEFDQEVQDGMDAVEEEEEAGNMSYDEEN